MAYIQGLEEQKAALKRIKDNLKEIEDVNKNLKEIEAGLKSAKDIKQIVEISFIMEDDSLKRIKCPVIVEDTDYLFEGLKKYKSSVVDAVHNDSKEYKISLEAKEKAMLDLESISE